VHVDVDVIGAGFAIKLKQAGFTDFVMLGDVDAPGGAWQWNTLSRHRRGHPVVQLPVLVRVASGLVAATVGAWN
jgi:cation diffusion facilitator CzcD-associated flavoprotein CzcO